MNSEIHQEMGETGIRFLAHWISACFGHFLRVVMPLVIDWPHLARYSKFPTWWSVLAFAGVTSLSAAIINANLPVTARELIKSVAMGFALNTTFVLFSHG